MDQVSLMRTILRIMGHGGDIKALTWSPEVLNVIDLLDAVPFEVRRQTELNTPQAGIQFQEEVPANEFWRLWGIQAVNLSSTTTLIELGFLPEGAGATFRPVIENSPGAGVRVTYTPPRPIWLPPASVAEARFTGCNALNTDDTVADFFFQRFIA